MGLSKQDTVQMVQPREATWPGKTLCKWFTQRGYMAWEEVSSPTEATLQTAVIEAQEGRDVATCDIPNAFVQTEVKEQDKDGHRTIMKICGALVNILVEIDPKYQEYVIEERGQPVLYVHIIKAFYGLLVSAMLFYQKLVTDLQSYGFELNLYDLCVANKTVKGTQMTVSWHVDDLKVSHIDPVETTSFIQWVKDTYGAIGEVKTTCGKVHEYLGMKLDYTVPGQVSINMVDYVKLMLVGFEGHLPKASRVTSPWNENLFKVQKQSPLLTQP